MIRLLRLDALQLIRDRLAVGVLAAELVACLIAVMIGVAWQNHLTSERESVRDKVESDQIYEREKWAGAAHGNPIDSVNIPSLYMITFQLAPPLLADFTVGRSAIEPAAASVRLSTRPDGMFARYQVENPERLARGTLDLTFVALVIAPLLLISLGYGVFTSDRESGTARLWLAQAGTPLRLIVMRSINRWALVFVPILLAGFTLWFVGPAERGGAILEWLGIVALVLCFWWSLILLINSFRISAETAALALVGLWTLLVFVAPVAIGSAAVLINPPPSHFEEIAATRAAEIAATRSYEDDHPELSSSTLEGRRAATQKGIEVRRTIARVIAPLQAETERQFVAQRHFGQRLSLLSPSLLASDTLASIAHTDSAAYATQREAAVRYFDTLAEALASVALGERPVDTEAFDALPRFEPPSPPQPPLFPILWVAIVTIVIISIALLRLRRMKPF